MLFLAILFLLTSALILAFAASGKKRKQETTKQTTLNFAGVQVVPGDSESSEATSKQQKERKFNRDWLENPDYKPWLWYDRIKDLMYCSTCQLCKMRNNMTQGSNVFQNCTLTRHMATDEHKKAAKQALTITADQDRMERFQEPLLDEKRMRARAHLMLAYTLTLGGAPMHM